MFRNGRIKSNRQLEDKGGAALYMEVAGNLISAPKQLLDWESTEKVNNALGEFNARCRDSIIKGIGISFSMEKGYHGAERSDQGSISLVERSRGREWGFHQQAVGLGRDLGTRLTWPARLGGGLNTPVMSPPPGRVARQPRGRHTPANHTPDAPAFRPGA